MVKMSICIGSLVNVQFWNVVLRMWMQVEVVSLLSFWIEASSRWHLLVVVLVVVGGCVGWHYCTMYCRRREEGRPAEGAMMDLTRHERRGG